MNLPYLSRICLALVAVAGLLGVGGRIASAETSTETGVSVIIVDEGVLDVSWGEGDLAFLQDGDNPALTAASPAVTATATFSLAIADSRADANRHGYSIAVSAGSFTAVGSTSPIGPDMLAIVGIGGLPEGSSGESPIGATLDSPVTVVTVASGASPVETTVTITIAMTISPGTMPGKYTGAIILDVLPLTAPYNTGTPKSFTSCANQPPASSYQAVCPIY